MVLFNLWRHRFNKKVGKIGESEKKSNKACPAAIEWINILKPLESNFCYFLKKNTLRLHVQLQPFFK